MPVKTLPGHLRADRGRPRPRRADPPGPGRGRARPRAGRGRPRRGRLVPRRRDRARHRRRRLDRLRALPPDRAPRRRAARSSSTTPSPRCSRSSASSSTSAASRAIPVLADVGNRAKMRQVFERYTPERRLPRGGLQARAADGGEPARGGAQQHARRRRSIAEVAVEFGVERFVLVSTDKARQPEDRDGPVEGALRVDRRGATAHATTSRRASSPSASATCSARPAASSRSSAARSSAAARSRSPTRR